jgi:phage terminase small subunit
MEGVIEMGRPKKLLEFNKKHFTNDEIKSRQATESAYKCRNDQLTPPEKLTDRAKAEFERIKSMAHWLDNLDLNELILYCYYWDKTLALVENFGGKPEDNEVRKALRDYHGEMRAISLKLGLSSIDRLKLSAPKTEKPANKFLEFIKS